MRSGRAQVLEAAFDPPFSDQAKLAALGASCIAGALGAVLLVARPTPDPLAPKE